METTITIQTDREMTHQEMLGHFITELLNTSKEDLNKPEHIILTSKIAALITNHD